MMACVPLHSGMPSTMALQENNYCFVTSIVLGSFYKPTICYYLLALITINEYGFI